MLTIEERTAWNADFETVIVDLNDHLNLQVQVFAERRRLIFNESKQQDKDIVLYEHRVENDEIAVDSMLCFLVDGACGSTVSCQPLESILKTSSTRMQNHERRRLLGDTETRRSVEFQGVVIREFGLTLGDHPNATSGPPVRLDWDHEEKETRMDLEEYEETRKPRRSRRQMKLSLSQRHHMLRASPRGHSLSEIKGAWKASLQIREQRIETSSQTLLQRKLDECWESLGRKYFRFLERVTLLCF